jgi:hypothetical protein
MIICDICHGHNDILPGKHNVPVEYEEGTLSFDKLDICYSCHIRLEEVSNLAKLKYIEQNRRADN